MDDGTPLEMREELEHQFIKVVIPAGIEKGNVTLRYVERKKYLLADAISFVTIISIIVVINWRKVLKKNSNSELED